MTDDRSDAIARLLRETEQAHGRYETTELQGVYDTAWAAWYAAYAVDHGIGDLLGHDVTSDQFAGFLASAFAEFERIDPRPSETWDTYIARRIAAEL